MNEAAAGGTRTQLLTNGPERMPHRRQKYKSTTDQPIQSWRHTELARAVVARRLVGGREMDLAVAQPFDLERLRQARRERLGKHARPAGLGVGEARVQRAHALLNVVAQRGERVLGAFHTAKLRRAPRYRPASRAARSYAPRLT